MSAEFSLIKQLELLCFDPYPTDKFQKTLLFLDHFRVLVEQMQEKNEFTLLELFCKMKVKPPPFCLNSSTEKIVSLLISLDVSTTICAVLVKLLKLLVIQLSECENYDAFHILADFRKVKLCIFAFRKSFLVSNVAIDRIVELFIKKIIKLLIQIDTLNNETKFHILNVMRIIVIELGQQPEFAAIITMQLLPFLNNESCCSFDNYFTFLCILKEIVLKINPESSKTCLLHLQQSFEEKQKETNAKALTEEEKYVIQHILKALGIVGMYSSVNNQVNTQ